MNWRAPALYAGLRLTGSRIPANLAEIRRFGVLSEGEARGVQAERLERLLRHAAEKVPYYAGIMGGNGADLGGLPVLTKDIIRREGGRLLASDAPARRPYSNSSGGSTGQPVTFTQDAHYYAWASATKQYFKELSGFGMGDREMRLWGSERDILKGGETAVRRFRRWLYNSQDLNAFRMGEAEMASFVKRWERFRPQWVEAYVQSAYLFARYLEREGKRLPAPRGLLVSAGVLVPEVKSYLEKVFGCPVHNRYGSREVSDMAYDRDADGILHLAWWNHVVEVVDDSGRPVKPGGTGRILVTSLTNYAMPLIRYEIGDRAVAGEGLTLRGVVGRQVELFTTADGTKIDGEYFTHLFYFKEWVGQFQVVQKKVDRIECRVVVRGTANAKEQEAIARDIRQVMGKGCAVDWILVDEIPPTPSGKHVYTLSEVK